MSNTPHRCPVCSGKGQVPCGFYDSTSGTSTLTNGTAPTTCRTCGGQGIVWGPDELRPLNTGFGQDSYTPPETSSLTGQCIHYDNQSDYVPKSTPGLPFFGKPMVTIAGDNPHMAIQFNQP